ncbi:hypothetical protein CEXT_268481 [Caerostris extrusa]|uniref:Uncharacterized protein n=1 Tax=Caerostris extrusa TaxID=172846 RepID=A0AAV4T508_CAEEX|nr:hypothetical protein CEXT_268481 [Caerostris extrusa]
MIDMEVSMEGNGPSQVHKQVPTSPVSTMIDPTKMTPQGLCRRLASAHQEMEVIDEIFTSAKKSIFRLTTSSLMTTSLKRRSISWNE